jgi:hypothetical protein
MGIPDEPHYEVSSTELAAWIEQQGADHWWTVDGDPFLAGRHDFPCPGDELAEELRRINRPLLVLDKHKSPGAKGQTIGRDKLDDLATRLADDFQLTGPKPPWGDNRLFLFRWKGADEDWALIEDEETAESERKEAAASQRKE